MVTDHRRMEPDAREAGLELPAIGVEANDEPVPEAHLDLRVSHRVTSPWGGECTQRVAGLVVGEKAVLSHPAPSVVRRS